MASKSNTVQPAAEVQVTGGVDTHKDTHTAAAVDGAGRVLGSSQFPADALGYAALLQWLRGFGDLVLVGIEGTGVYGHGLARHLQQQQVPLVEVDRPDRKARRWQGKSDPVDAEAAARAALARVRTGTPKQRDGRVEALRALRVQRGSAPRRPAATAQGARRHRPRGAAAAPTRPADPAAAEHLRPRPTGHHPG